MDSAAKLDLLSDVKAFGRFSLAMALGAVGGSLYHVPDGTRASWAWVRSSLSDWS